MPLASGAAAVCAARQKTEDSGQGSLGFMVLLLCSHAIRFAQESLNRAASNVPMKPQRVYQCMNNVFGRDVCYVSTIGLSQIAAAQFLHVYKPRHWINCGHAGPLGWTLPAALGVVKADPKRKVVALSGDYDSSS
jgi:glyoxylate carboligase